MTLRATETIGYATKKRVRKKDKTILRLVKVVTTGAKRRRKLHSHAEKLGQFSHPMEYGGW